MKKALFATKELGVGSKIIIFLMAAWMQARADLSNLSPSCLPEINKISISTLWSMNSLLDEAADTGGEA
jgi:hypothetical protein